MMVWKHQRAWRLVLLSILLLTGLFAADPAFPQAAAAKTSQEEIFPETETPSQWDFSLRPYLFLSGLAGSVTAGPVTLPINSGFGDLVDHLRIGGFLAFTAEKEKWGFYADFQYISLVGKSTGRIDAALELENLIAEADVSFRPGNTPTLKFMAGVRLYTVEQTLSFREEELPQVGTTVIDPILGAHGVWELNDRWDFELRGDIGGFGVSSEFTYQLLALFHWDISNSINVPFGYRILSYQIQTGDIWMDTRMSGLVLGLDFRF